MIIRNVIERNKESLTIDDKNCNEMNEYELQTHLKFIVERLNKKDLITLIHSVISGGQLNVLSQYSKIEWTREF